MKISSTSSPLIDEIPSLYGGFEIFICLCFLQRWLVGQVVTAEKIRQAKDFYQLHFGYNLFNEEGKLCHANYL